jgi:hypothetical protein
VPYRRRSSHRHRAPAAAVRHLSERADLSRRFAGIDRDIERLFLSLPATDLDQLLRRYGSQHGEHAEVYARETYSSWKKGNVKMSGQTASRLLDLLPPYLPSSVRFDLVKRLRLRHFKRRSLRILSTPLTWRSDIKKPLQELVASSTEFALPPDLLDKARWLADGDAVVAQKLLAAAEQEDAAIRVAYIDEELRRIEALLLDIDTTRRVTHTLSLPQGEIVLTVELPARTLLQKLSDWLR